MDRLEGAGLLRALALLDGGETASALIASVDSDMTAASRLRSSTAFSRRSFVSAFSPFGASCQSS